MGTEKAINKVTLFSKHSSFPDSLVRDQTPFELEGKRCHYNRNQEARNWLISLKNEGKLKVRPREGKERTSGFRIDPWKDNGSR